MAESSNAGVNSDPAWTVRRILDWTTAHLEKHGSDSPRLDAEILLAHSRNCPRIELYTRYNELPSDDERSTMRRLVQRRAQAEPVAYLVGYREFFGLEFQVTGAVLIPRPDTETLVVELLETAQRFSNPRVLDIGTGSGCIAITTAVNNPSAQLTAIDISPAALDIARQNAVAHQTSERIRFLEGNLFEPLEPGETFDVIASNPPYVTDGEIKTLQADVRRHEPHLALAGGPDGLTIVRQLIEQSSEHLVSNGEIFLEISPEQADTVCDLFNAHGAFTAAKVTKDLAGRARVVNARKV